MEWVLHSNQPNYPRHKAGGFLNKAGVFKPPALCRGSFGWLLLAVCNFLKPPGLVPGIVGLVATVRKRLASAEKAYWW